MEIRGYLLIKSVGNAITEPFTQDLFGDELISSPKKHKNPLSNHLCICICNGLINKYPRIFKKLTPFLILKADLAIIFCDRLGYVKETQPVKNCDIGLAHCRSFPGFEMMELLLPSIKNKTKTSIVIIILDLATPKQKLNKRHSQWTSIVGRVDEGITRM